MTDVRQILSDGSTVVGADPGRETPTDALGQLVANLTDVERDELDERVAHLQEMLTGYRSGSADLAIADEPRTEYRPERPISDRQDAKAKELGIGVRTIQRWFARATVNICGSFRAVEAGSDDDQAAQAVVLQADAEGTPSTHHT